MKKLGAMLLALCMVCSLAAPAFADALPQEAPLEAATADAGGLPAGEAPLMDVEAAKQEKAKDVYFNGFNGNDSKDGLTADTAVYTLSKALELLAPNGTLHCITGIKFPGDGAKTELKDITIVRERSNYVTVLLQVNGGTLTLDNVTVDGKQLPNVESALVEVVNGTLNINGNTKLTGNINAIDPPNGGGCGGGIYADNSTVNLNGGEISENSVAWESGNNAPAGGGVYARNKSTVNLNGTKITDNAAGGPGGGVYAWDSEINLNGTTKITGNAADGNGGGIFAYISTVNLNSGEISENSTANVGGGIYAWDSTVNLNGTKITGNASAGSGGGIFIDGVDETAAFTMTGGEISGNSLTEANYSGAGIYAWGDCRLSITGGSIQGNTDETVDDPDDALGTAIMLHGGSLPELSLSGSPVISGDVCLEGEDESPFIRVPAAFAPADPVQINAFHYTGEPTAVRYENGQTPNLAHFSSRDKPYGLKVDGQDIKWVQKYDVSFYSEDNRTKYERIYVMPGEKIDASLAPAPAAPTTGLYLAGWQPYHEQELWDFDKNTVNKDMMTLLAAWGVLPPDSVELKAESSVIYTGGSVTLTASAVQENPDAAFAYEWYKDGQPLPAPDEPTLKATEEGSYTVKVRAKLDGRPESEPVESAAVTLVMRDPPVPDTALALDKTSLSLSPGQTAGLKAVLSPADATYKVIFWTSSDETVATVSDSGVVTALAEGKATITAQSWYGSTAVCEVTVKKADDPTPPDEPDKPDPWPTEGLEGFVTRCYRVALSRSPDKEGYADWIGWLKDGTVDATSCTYGFVFSKEMTDKNLSDEDFVKTLYRLFMDREGEAAGVTFWKNYLRGGHGREEVFRGFADSVEFARIKADYGIQ